MAQLVPGDIVRLAAGDLVPADGVLLAGRDLFVNQALLTGESYPLVVANDGGADHCRPEHIHTGEPVEQMNLARVPLGCGWGANIRCFRSANRLAPHASRSSRRTRSAPMRRIRAGLPE